MKKMICIMLIFVVLISLSTLESFADSTTLYLNDNFSNYSVGHFVQSGIWKKSASNASNISAIIEENAKHSLKLEAFPAYGTTSNVGVYANSGLPNIYYPDRRQVYFEFKFTGDIHSKKEIWGNIFIVEPLSSNDSTNYLKVYTGASPIAIAPVSPDDWHSIRIVYGINPKTSYEIELDGIGVTNTALSLYSHGGYSANFVYGTSTLCMFRIYAGSSLGCTDAAQMFVRTVRYENFISENNFVTSIADGGTIPRDGSILFEFINTINQVTLNMNTLILKKGNEVLSGVNGKWITPRKYFISFNNALLVPYADYTLTVTNGILDIYGTAVQEKTFNFSTVLSEKPLDISGKLEGSHFYRDCVSKFSVTAYNNTQNSLDGKIVFAFYNKNTLVDINISDYSVPSGVTTFSKYITPHYEKATMLKALVLGGVDTVQPLTEYTYLVEGYSKVESNIGMSNLITEHLTIPSNDAELNERFPIRQQIRPQYDRGDVISGVGVLGYFEDGGPKEVYVRRETSILSPASQRFKAFCTARVIDPDGKVVCYYDFSDQNLADEAIVMKVPNGRSGIWRLSYINGLNNVDDITFGIPQTDAWGIRGEMTMCFTEKTDKEWYMYIPRTAERVNVSTGGSQGNSIKIYSDQGVEFQRISDRYYRYFIDVERTDVVWKVVFDGTTNAFLTFCEGVPGVLCPTEAMARKLKGGVVESGGLLVGGGLQARTRTEMLKIKDENLTVNLNFEENIPDYVTDYDIEALPFGLYGGLSSLQNGLSGQILDYTSPYYGAFGTDTAGRASWENFHWGGRHTMSEMASLASLAAVPTKLNPAYGNEALMNRSILAAFSHFVSLSPEDLEREGAEGLGGGTSQQFWPVTHVFFIYPAQAEAYNLLKGKIDPVTAQVWRDALVVMGDKLANLTQTLTNQWNEVTYGHLQVYMATGEERFLRYYERNIGAICKDNLSVSGSSLGQDAAGYFYELSAPDGSYQQLSLYNVVAGYYDYKDLSNANPALVERLRDSIERAVKFESLYWLPEPNGRIISPTAVNGRTTMMMCNEGYPGIYLAAVEFHLAAGLANILPLTPLDFTKAKTMPFIAINNSPVAKELVKYGLEGEDNAYPTSSLSGSWTPRLFRAYIRPERASPVNPPVLEEQGVWDLNGQLSLKQNGLYTMTYYKCPSTTQSYRSALPFSVWGEGIGSVIISNKANNTANLEVPKIGFSGIVTQKLDGSYYTSTLENSQFSWVSPDTEYELTTNLEGISGQFKVKGLMDSNGLNLTVSLNATNSQNNVYISLPINSSNSDAVISVATDGCFSYMVGTKKVEIRCQSGIIPVLDTFVMTTDAGVSMRALKIPIPVDNTAISIQISIVN
jgi:hypothetical protein